MRVRHLPCVLLALGLSLSLLIGLAGTVPAQTPGEGAAAALYLPWVHNGDELDGASPWFGTVTVQNLEDTAISATITTAGGEDTTFLLNAHAQKTFTAAQLGVAEGGEGVVVNANWANSSNDTCMTGTATVTHGAADATDTFSVPAGMELAAVTGISQGATTFPAAAYTVGGIGSGTGRITWSPSGAEPAVGSDYAVRFRACGRLPWIGAVEKHMMPELFTSAQTSSAQVAVDGYSALSAFDLPRSGNAGGVSQSVLPIVQTNNGWDSIIHVTNFGADNAGVTMTFYGAGGQGAASPSFGPFTQTLANGETWTFDAAASGIPEGWVGTAFISADGAEVVTQVDRVKPETAMALTNLAGPYLGGATRPTLYAPLVFKDYNGWNTGINVANLEDTDNTIQITYYGQNGNVVDTEQITIPARGMEFVYRPNVGDLGLGPASITAAVISDSDGPIHAAVDEVKYTGAASEGAGHAMSYLATAQGAYAGARLSLPLFQKGSLSGDGDTSGINLFNPDGQFSATGELTFYDASGAPVAPTLNTPLTLTLSAFQSATVYAFNYAEMPEGFQGAAAIEVVAGQGRLVGVSNNVNYTVEGDGSTVYNLLSTCGNFTLGCTPAGGPHPEGFTLDLETQTLSTDDSPARVTVTVRDRYGNPVPGLTVDGTVTSGPNAGRDLTAGAALQAMARFLASGTDQNGQAVLEDRYDDQSNGLGTDVIDIWVDLNDDGASDNGEHATARVTWTAGEPATIDLTASATEPTAGETVTLTATVTDQYGNLVADDTAVSFTVTGTHSGTATSATKDGVATATDSQKTPGADAWAASTANGATSDPVTVTWRAGSPGQITLEVSTDGGATWGSGPITRSVDDGAVKIRAHVTDALGNTVADDTEVTFRATGAHARSATAQTGGGYAEIDESPTSPGTDAWTAQAGGITAATPLVVTWAPGAPTTIALTATPNPLTVGTNLTLTATVTDQFDNPVADDTAVSFTITSSDASVGHDTDTSALTTNGVATITDYQEKVATDTWTVTAGAATATVSVTWVAGAPATITLAASEAAPVVGSEVTLTATVTDAFGNAVGAGHSIALTLTATDGGNPRTPASGDNPVTATTGNDGVATITDSQEKVGTDTWQASWADDGSVTSSPVDVTWVADVAAEITLEASTNGTDWSLDPVSLQAGSTVYLRATVRDQYGNPVGTTSVTFGATGAHAVTKTATTSGGVASTSDAQTTGTGDDVWTASVGALPSNTVTVSWQPGSPNKVVFEVSPDGTTWSTDPLSLTVDSHVFLRARVMDQYDNPVGDGYPVRFYLPRQVPPYKFAAMTNTSGIASLANREQVAGQVTYWACYANPDPTCAVTSNQITVTWEPGPAAKIELTASPTSPVAGGTVTLSATVRDQYDNLVKDGTSVTFMLTSSTANPQHPTVGKSATTTNGVATVTDTQTTVGTDTWLARVTANSSVQTTVDVAWVAGSAANVSLEAADYGPHSACTTPGTFEPASLTLTVGQCLMLRATVTDANGNPVEGVHVYFYLPREPTKYHQSLGTTDIKGQIILSTTYQTAGTDVYWASMDDQGTGKQNEVTVTWAPDVPSSVVLEAKRSSDPDENWSSGPITLSVDDRLDLRATVKDQYGNLVANGTQAIFTTGSGDAHPNRSQTISTAGGLAEITAHGETTPGQDTWTVTAGGKSASLTVTWLASLTADQTDFTATAAGSTTVTVDFTITGYNDANPLPGGATISMTRAASTDETTHPVGNQAVTGTFTCGPSNCTAAIIVPAESTAASDTWTVFLDLDGDTTQDPPFDVSGPAITVSWQAGP